MKMWKLRICGTSLKGLAGETRTLKEGTYFFRWVAERVAQDFLKNAEGSAYYDTLFLSVHIKKDT